MKRLLEGKTLLWLALGLMLLAGAMTLFQGEADGGMTQEERRVAQVLGAISGAGEVEVALFYVADGYGEKPTGAVVVASGAESMEVRLNLARAVRTLLSLPEAAVDVFVMEDGR